MNSKRLTTKITVIIAALVIIIATVGATVAYIVRKTPSVENEFEPIAVSCLIVDSSGGTNKTDVAVKNTSNVSVYLRATFIVNWVSTENGSIYPAMPKESVDYSIVFGSGKWQKASDGYYYYSSPIFAAGKTDVFISSFSEDSVAPEGYTLSVSILASAVQAEPKNVVTELWGISVLDNGNLLID